MACSHRYHFCLQHASRISYERNSSHFGKLKFLLTVLSWLVNLILFFIGIKQGPLIMNPHIITLWAWYIIIHLRGLKNHSGYSLPFLPVSEQHDYHHMTSTSCFGKSLVLDWLHGTDKGFRAHLAKKKLLGK